MQVSHDRAEPVNLERLPERWRRAPRRWGHPLHSLCSYFAMFPPQLPSVFIQWLTSPGDAVYDPFCGRGTVALEAVLGGRIGYASDANPMATALTGAKVQIPSRTAVHARITQLEHLYEPPGLEGVPPKISMLYSKSTLQQLVYLREQLARQGAVDSFLVGALLGLLHGNHSRGGATRALSISMPNTFAMSPDYVRRYIVSHELKVPIVDVFKMLRRRIDQLDLPPTRFDGGRVWRQDAAAPAPAWLRSRKVKLVFTSPPYLGVIKYGKYNWVRLWFLGFEPKEVDRQLVATGSLSRYRSFMQKTLANLATVIRDDGYVCLVIGDVRSRRTSENVNLSEEVWTTVAKPAGWHLHGVITDRLPANRKVSRIWKDSSGRATKTDRILILSPRETTCGLPRLGRIDWTKRATWPSIAGAGGMP